MVRTIGADRVVACPTSQGCISTAISYAHSTVSDIHWWSTFFPSHGRSWLWYSGRVLCFCPLFLFLSFLQAPGEELALIVPFFRASPEWSHVILLCHRNMFPTDQSTSANGSPSYWIASEFRRPTRFTQGQNSMICFWVWFI